MPPDGQPVSMVGPPTVHETPPLIAAPRPVHTAVRFTGKSYQEALLNMKHLTYKMILALIWGFYF